MCIRDSLNIDAEEALRIYYSSRLAEQINEGAYGIQYICLLYTSTPARVNDFLPQKPAVHRASTYIRDEEGTSLSSSPENRQVIHFQD